MELLHQWSRKLPDGTIISDVIRAIEQTCSGGVTLKNVRTPDQKPTKNKDTPKRPGKEKGRTP